MTTLNERLTSFTKLGDVFRKRNGEQQDGKTNGATIFLTAIVTKHDETAPDVALCTYTEVPDGICDGLADDANNLANDAQNPISDDTNITFTNPTINDEFILTLYAGQGCTKDALAVISADGAGFAESMEPDNESIAQVPPFRILGKWMHTKAAVSNKARHAWCKKI